jgi:hypothetical protein
VAGSAAPNELRIAVTGHRVIVDVPRVLAGIAEALERIEAAFPGRSLVVISALAEGADRLVADAVLRRSGARLRVVLPMPRFDYLADFATPDSRDAFLRLLARAAEVLVLPPRASRGEAYAAANDVMLADGEVLLVIWDGDGARGQGGTAEVVAQARARHMPLAWIHAGNRAPDAMEPASLGVEQGSVTFENL